MLTITARNDELASENERLKEEARLWNDHKRYAFLDSIRISKLHLGFRKVVIDKNVALLRRSDVRLGGAAQLG